MHKPEEPRCFQKPLLINFLLILMVICGDLPGQLYAAEIAVSVDRNPASLDESFKIIFTANDTPDGEPDFSPLAQDFTVINQSQSSNSSWVNGNYSKSINWVVEVTANKVGKLTVPAILFGKDSSEPLQITVNENTANNATANSNEDIFLDVKATPENPLVQSQVIYTIRLYRRVDLAQAELSEPELADAVVEKLGEDSNFNTVENGVSYLVTERKYAIFPQKSGTTTIKPLALTAAIILDRQPDFRDFFGSRMTKTKRVLSKEVTLNVKPAPSSFTGEDWLAAEKIELSQEWSGDIQQMKVGEPLTRTLTVKGIGTTVGQLPELNRLKSGDDLKAYPDQPTLNEAKQADGIVAKREEKIALIPATPGQHVLPALEIPWFNTQSQMTEIARIPETTLNVIGTVENSPPELNSGKPLAAKPSLSGSAPESNAKTTANESPSWQNTWLWSSLFLAFGWLLTVIYFLKIRTPSNRGESENAKTHAYETSLKEAVNRLKAACNQNDATVAKNALIDWGKLKFDATNLGAVAEKCDARLRDEILNLNQCLYGKGGVDWVGKKLYQAFTENRVREKNAADNSSELEPLHRL